MNPFLIFLRKVRTALWISKNLVMRYIETLNQFNIFYNYYILGGRSVIIVIDTFCSPPTYADVGFAAFFARYLTRIGFQVNFYYICSEFREDWNDLPERNNKKAFFAEQQFAFLQAIINSPECIASKLSWAEFVEDLNSSYPKKCMPFDKFIKVRRGAYHCFGRLHNMIFNRLKSIFDVDFLFSYEEFSDQINKKCPPTNKYITVGARYSTYWDIERNLKPHEFLQTISLLNSRFPSHDIMILSCDSGCEYFRTILEDNSINVLFSDAYSDNLLGDASLLLKSDFFYILRGGGISWFAQCSNVPFECYQDADQSMLFRHNKLFAWNNNYQIIGPSSSAFKSESSRHRISLTCRFIKVLKSSFLIMLFRH